MNISAKLAQTVVSDIKQIIDQEINYIDTNGIIIASTDTSRIGSFHGGAKRVIKTGEELIIQEDEQYSGARKGINTPVYFENKIVGVIGITGEKQDVEKYGRILKRMTELLIKEEYIERLKNQEKENQRIIIGELLFEGTENNEIVSLSPLNFYNLNPNAKRVVIVSEILGESSKIIKALDGIYKVFNEKLMNYHSENLLMQNMNQIIIILRYTSIENINLILADLTKEIQIKYGLETKFGIGTIEDQMQNLKYSYAKARNALYFISATDFNKIKFYSEMDIELILDDVSKNIAKEFSKKVLGNLEDKEIQEYGEIVNLFEKFNGSISKISDALFIHKNTLQYRLNRLYTKTGYDMRNYKDFAILKMAFSLHKIKN